MANACSAFFGLMPNTLCFSTRNTFSVRGSKRARMLFFLCLSTRKWLPDGCSTPSSCGDIAPRSNRSSISDSSKSSTTVRPEYRRWRASCTFPVR